MNMEGYDRDMEEALELMKCKLPEYLIKEAVAHGKRLSQKIQQLLNNKSLEYIFYTNM